MTVRPVVLLVGAMALYLVANGAAALGLKARAGASPLSDQPRSEQSTTPSEDATFKTKIQPFLTKYCVECHKGDKPKGGISLDAYQSEAHARKDRKNWGAVQHILAAGDMPPEKKPQPTKAEREFVINWIENTLTKVDCNGPKDPGRVTIRRLNRAEYNNTIRDLCGVDFKPADEFPSDDVGYGFDNIGDVLSFQPVLLEKYMTAADKILGTAQDRRSREEFEADLPAAEYQRHSAARQVARPGQDRVQIGRIGLSGEVQLPGRRRLRDSLQGWGRMSAMSFQRGRPGRRQGHQDILGRSRGRKTADVRGEVQICFRRKTRLDRFTTPSRTRKRRLSASSG